MTAQRRPRPARRWRRRAALLGASSLLSLALAEVGLRVVNAALHPAIYELDDDLGWRHAPGVDRTIHDEQGRAVRFATDAHGLRRVPARAGDGGVLFVGDSFTQASQVEAAETFVARCQELLDEPCHDAGVGGYSTLQQLLALPDHLRRLRPRLCVLAVYENDFADNLMPYFSGLGPRPYARVVDAEVRIERELEVARFEPFLQPAPAAFWLYRNCAIYRSVHKNVFLRRRGAEVAEREERERAALPLAEQRVVMRELLRRLAAAAGEAGSELRVAALPTRAMVRDGSAPSHDWLAVTCRELGLPFLSLLEPLRAVGAERAYFARDIHFTREGHAGVAAALAAFAR